MRALFLVLVALAGAAGCSRDAVEPPPAVASAGLSASAGHLLLVLELDQDTLRVVSARPLASDLPRFKVPPHESWRLELLDRDGKELWSAPVRAANQVRGEFADESGAITASHVTLSKTTFAAHVPALASGATVRLVGEAWTLPASDHRRDHLAPEAAVELGRAALPEVLP